MNYSKVFNFIDRYSDPSGLEIHSFKTVRIGDWIVRVSVSNVDSVIIIMIKAINPSEMVMGTFTDENDANKFLNFWLGV